MTNNYYHANIVDTNLCRAKLGAFPRRIFAALVRKESWGIISGAKFALGPPAKNGPGRAFPEKWGHSVPRRKDEAYGNYKAQKELKETKREIDSMVGRTALKGLHPLQP